MDVATRLLAVAAPDGRAVAVGAQHRRAARGSSRRRADDLVERRGRRTRARALDRTRHGRGDRAADAARGDRRARSPTSARSRDAAEALDAPIAVLDADRRQGPRVRPRRRRRAAPPRHAGPRRAAPALRHDHPHDEDARRSCTPSRCPKGLTPEPRERLTPPQPADAHARVRARQPEHPFAERCCAGSAWCRP